MRPAEVCRHLLIALDASEGRRRRRKRDTTPDSIGLALKRNILEQTMQDDPDPADYEGWLVARCHRSGEASGPMLAMAREILSDWQLAQKSVCFRSWLDEGAPSDDTAS